MSHDGTELRTTFNGRSRKVFWYLTLVLLCCLIGGTLSWEYKKSQYSHLAAPLYIAVKNNQAREVDRLLAAGADPNWLSLQRDTSSDTANRATPTFLERCRQLIDRLRGRSNQDSATNEPALLIAVENNNTSIVHALLQAEADPNTKAGTNSCVLMLAARQADMEIVRELIQKGANVNPPLDARELTPLQWALRRGEPELARLLLDSGARAAVQDEEGRTPLIQAVSSGDSALVKALLAHGAAVNVRNKFGMTALKIARMDRNDEIVEMLERAGATE